jgi:hypothetical protein
VLKNRFGRTPTCGGKFRKHYAGEVLSARELEPPPGKAPDEREIKIAEQLVAALEDDFRPEEYTDWVRVPVQPDGGGGLEATPKRGKAISSCLAYRCLSSRSRLRSSRSWS